MLWSSEALPFATKPNFKKSAFSLVTAAQFLNYLQELIGHVFPYTRRVSVLCTS